MPDALSVTVEFTVTGPVYQSYPSYLLVPDAAVTFHSVACGALVSKETFVAVPVPLTRLPPETAIVRSSLSLRALSVP